jgi:formylmethanofuran dehydrogenase subunit E
MSYIQIIRKDMEEGSKEKSEKQRKGKKREKEKENTSRMRKIWVEKVFMLPKEIFSMYFHKN